MKIFFAQRSGNWTSGSAEECGGSKAKVMPHDQILLAIEAAKVQR